MANLDNVLCLEEKIIEQFESFDQDLYFHFAPDDKRKTTEKVKDKLKELRFSAGALYWWIYNEHPGCNPQCGTMYFTFHLWANAQILEKMLRDIVDRRLKYGF